MQQPPRQDEDIVNVNLTIQLVAPGAPSRILGPYTGTYQLVQGTHHWNVDLGAVPDPQLTAGREASIIWHDQAGMAHQAEHVVLDVLAPPTPQVRLTYVARFSLSP